MPPVAVLACIACLVELLEFLEVGVDGLGEHEFVARKFLANVAEILVTKNFLVDFCWW